MRKHPLTWTLIMVNVLVFLLVLSMPEGLQELVFNTFYLSRGTALQLWRWFTAMFLHDTGGVSHLFFNMLGLYFFGKNLEEETNKQWFLFIYFVSGLVGSMVFIFTNASPVVGASGAVFGLLGASMLLNPTKRVHIYLFPLPLGIVAVAFIIFESMVAYFQPARFANVATVAHLSGIITGSLFAFFYDPKKSLEGVFVLLLCLGLLVILGPVFSLITGIGSLVLQLIERVVGSFLYGLAGMLSFIWS